MNSPRPRQHQSQTRTRSRRTGRTYFGIYLAELPWGAPRPGDDVVGLLSMPLALWPAVEKAPNVREIIDLGATAIMLGFQAAFNGYSAFIEQLPARARKIERLCKRATLIGALSFVVMALVYGGLLASGAIQPNLVAARARNMRLALEGDAEAMSRLAGQFRDGRGDGDRFSAHVH